MVSAHTGIGWAMRIKLESESGSDLMSVHSGHRGCLGL